MELQFLTNINESDSENLSKNQSIISNIAFSSIFSDSNDFKIKDFIQKRLNLDSDSSSDELDVFAFLGISDISSVGFVHIQVFDKEIENVRKNDFRFDLRVGGTSFATAAKLGDVSQFTILNANDFSERVRVGYDPSGLEQNRNISLTITAGLV